MRGINVALVQQTWEQVVPIADEAALAFYSRLFELDPSLRSMFRQTDMVEQRRKLMQMITVAVRGLNRFDELMPALQAMGRRHVGYGVQDHHYDTVGAALLWTLEQGLGDAFTPEARESWTLLYGTLASIMKTSSRSIAA
jgi:hemoglobin-like flavoprotein